MAVLLNFPGQTTGQNVGSITREAVTSSMPFKYNKSHLTMQPRKRKMEYSIFTTTRKSTNLYVIPSKGNSNLGSSPLTLSDMVLHLYACVNEKDLKQLSDLIADECLFDDCSFPNPFHGKKEVMRFLEQLTTSMGQNVKFNIGNICEGDDLTASVDWHLEWKKARIPFTRGGSFYACSMKGGRLKIKKAQVLIETPIKPGSLVLVLLKTVTSFFDDYPKAAEWFLESPHVILQWIMKIYHMFVRPFVSPLLAGYIKIWSFIARLVSYTLKLTLLIYKLLF